MKKEKRFKLWLEAHSEGEGTSMAMEGSNDGLASQESESPEVVYGIQDDEEEESQPAEEVEAEGQPGTEEEQPAPADDYKSIRQKYKSEIDGEIQDAIKRRFRNSTDFESKYNSLNDSLAPLYSKYELEFGDSEALFKAMADDTELFADAAIEAGMTPEAYMQLKNAERKAQVLEAREKEAQERERANRDWQTWQAQEAELKKIYPNMSLAEEMQNPQFATLLNRLGDVKTAYHALHADEIISGAIQKASTATKKAVTDNIAARGLRPSENGTRSQKNVIYKTNVDELTDKDLDDIIKQVKAGKKIRF